MSGMPKPVIIRVTLDVYLESLDGTVPDHDDVAKEVHDILHRFLVVEKAPDSICEKEVIAIDAYIKDMT